MRSYPERPIVGVGAVVFDGSRVLLVRRGHAPLLGAWNLPGGAVESGETLAEAVVREVREETGLTVEAGALVDVVDRIHRDAEGRVEFHYVVADYLCIVRGGRLACASDAADVRWVPLDGLASYAIGEAALRVIDKALVLARATS